MEMNLKLQLKKQHKEMNNMIYFEINPETKEHASADHVFTWTTAWTADEVLADLKLTLGFNPDKNIELNTWILRVDNIPPGLESQFKKNRIHGRYEARMKSEINQKFLSIVKKYNLTTYSMTEFAIPFGLGNIKSLCPVKLNDSYRFFIEITKNLPDGILTEFRTNPALTEVPEYEYLQLRAEMLKNESEI